MRDKSVPTPASSDAASPFVRASSVGRGPHDVRVSSNGGGSTPSAPTGSSSVGRDPYGARDGSVVSSDQRPVSNDHPPPQQHYPASSSSSASDVALPLDYHSQHASPATVETFSNLPLPSLAQLIGSQQLRELGLRVVHLKSRQDIYQTASNFRPDLIVSVRYPRRIHLEVLELVPPGLAINLHPSLLPKHRGSLCQFWAIFEGDEVTGVTAHEMVEEFDLKPVLVDLHERLHSSKIPSSVWRWRVWCRTTAGRDECEVDVWPVSTEEGSVFYLSGRGVRT